MIKKIPSKKLNGKKYRLIAKLEISFNALMEVLFFEIGKYTFSRRSHKLVTMFFQYRHRL